MDIYTVCIKERDRKEEKEEKMSGRSGLSKSKIALIEVLVGTRDYYQK
jgi:hypothetical protein